jgi:predicted RNA-binding protein (virulence factor B family)
MKMGAFLDWGLAKDLPSDRAEQARVRAGEWVLIRIVLDAKRT